MAGDHLERRRSRPLSPVRERGVRDHIRDITELLETIHNLAVSQGLSGDVMATWEIGMIRLCIGEGDQHPAFLRNNEAVDFLFVDLREMERQLTNNPHRVSNVIFFPVVSAINAHSILQAIVRTGTGNMQLAEHYTVQSFKDSIETADPFAFQSFFTANPQHSLGRHSRVSGRYAAMMGLDTDGVARDGGYRLARF